MATTPLKTKNDERSNHGKKPEIEVESGDAATVLSPILNELVPMRGKGVHKARTTDVVDHFQLNHTDSMASSILISSQLDENEQEDPHGAIRI